MREILGSVALDRGGESLFLRTDSQHLRDHSAKVIKKVAPEGRIKIDGSVVRLDILTALALRSKKGATQFQWTEEAARYIDTFGTNYADAPAARRRLRELLNPGIASKALSDYRLGKQLDPHQTIAVAAMTDPRIRGMCLFDEQGLGKTAMTIHAFDRLREKDASIVLMVFAPKNMLEEWKKDFHKFTHNRYVVQVITGSKGEKYDGLIARADVYVTNYETAHTLERPLQSLLSRYLGKVVMTVDESFFVKNRGTKRAGAIRRLRTLCDRCWMLCGTPAPNNALDVIHQFDVADGGVTFGGISLPKNSNDLRMRIKEIVEQKGVYLRRLKSEVLPDLPEKQFRRILVPMEAIQRESYQKQLQGLIRDVREVDETTFQKRYATFLGKRMLLFEICSHPAQVLKDYQSVPGKVVAIDHLLDELIQRRHEKVVLWSFFRFSLDQLWKRYQRFHPVKLDGSMPDTKERSESVRRFQESEETKLFIGNPAAGGAGITLTRGRIAIYESFSVQAAHYFQSLDRIHRRGQTRQTEYYVLLCEDSIEEDEYDRLVLKERYSKELFGEPLSDVPSREMFLDELLRSLRRVS